MKKAIIGAVAIILIGGTLVFANTTTTKTEGKICPDRPGCICSDNGECKITSQEEQTDNSTICPDRPGCICSK